MEYPKRIFRANDLLCAGLAICVFFLAFASMSAETVRFDSAGARFGVENEYYRRGFRQAEAFGVFDLPWSWKLGRDWHLQSRFDISGGWLRGRNKDAGIMTAGPSLIVSRGTFPVSLDLGSSLTLLTRHTFGATRFGTPVQFTSHAGANWDFAGHWRVGYRYQHMSNARLHRYNPGLDLHVLAVSYRF